MENENKVSWKKTYHDENGQTYTGYSDGMWFDGDGNWVKLDDVSGLFIDEPIIETYSNPLKSPK